MNIKHCKICGQVEFGTVHILQRDLNQIYNERHHAEMKGDLQLAEHIFKMEAWTKEQLFKQAGFSDFGFHEFEPEDNLDIVERLAKERGLV